VKDLILEAVDNEYLIKIKYETLGYLNQTPRQMLHHLLARGGALDFPDTKELLAKRDGEWNVSKNPQLYFNRVEKAMKGLLRNGIISDPNERRDIALFYLKATGEFDAAVREWEAKPAANKTWANIKTFISAKYAKENKQNNLTAKQFKANVIDEQAEATEELIAALTEAHTKQMETLIKSTTDTMKEMMLLLKDNKSTNNSTKLTDEEKKKKRDKKQKKYNDAPICKHCGKKHPTKAEDDCWELEKNNDSHPLNWKSVKSTCAGTEVSETWQPGVVKIKISTDHTYLVDTNFWSPLDNDNDDKDEENEEEINTIKAIIPSTKQKLNKWTRQIARRQQHKIIIDSGATSHFMSEDLHLPTEEASNKEVYLPSNAKLRTSRQTKLPFDNLTNAAREADVLPGLKRSLLSVNKMSEEGYTTIFHPGEDGVTIHKEGTITITTSEPPVLTGGKSNSAKLWTISTPDNRVTKEEVNNVYSLPSIPHTIRYLHAMAGHPVKDTWLDAIKAGNYLTWPGLTTTAVRKHFPESDETQQGHMKKQRQGVRSTNKMQMTSNVPH